MSSSLKLPPNVSVFNDEPILVAGGRGAVAPLALVVAIAMRSVAVAVAVRLQALGVAVGVGGAQGEVNHLLAVVHVHDSG